METKEKSTKEKLQELEKISLANAEAKVKAFLDDLKIEGFALDASIEVSRHGNHVNIFLIKL